MATIAAIAWPMAHATGTSGWHWADLLTALLAFLAVAGLTLLARGRRARVRLGFDRDAGPIAVRGDAETRPSAERRTRSARPAVSAGRRART